MEKPELAFRERQLRLWSQNKEISHRQTSRCHLENLTNHPSDIFQLGIGFLGTHDPWQTAVKDTPDACAAGSNLTGPGILLEIPQNLREMTTQNGLKSNPSDARYRFLVDIHIYNATTYDGERPVKGHSFKPNHHISSGACYDQ